MPKSMRRTTSSTRPSTMPARRGFTEIVELLLAAGAERIKWIENLKTYPNMANEKMKPQSPEEIARAAQEAALEQMRAMMGSIRRCRNARHGRHARHKSWPRCRLPYPIWPGSRRSRLRWERSAEGMPPPWPMRHSTTWRRPPQRCRRCRTGVSKRSCARRMPQRSTGWARTAAGRSGTPRRAG